YLSHLSPHYPYSSFFRSRFRNPAIALLRYRSIFFVAGIFPRFGFGDWAGQRSFAQAHAASGSRPRDAQRRAKRGAEAPGQRTAEIGGAHDSTPVTRSSRM